MRKALASMRGWVEVTAGIRFCLGWAGLLHVKMLGEEVKGSVFKLHVRDCVQWPQVRGACGV